MITMRPIGLSGQYNYTSLQRINIRGTRISNLLCRYALPSKLNTITNRIALFVPLVEASRGLSAIAGLPSSVFCRSCQSYMERQRRPILSLLHLHVSRPYCLTQGIRENTNTSGRVYQEIKSEQRLLPADRVTPTSIHY